MLGRRSSRIYAEATQTSRCEEIEMSYGESKPTMQWKAVHWEVKGRMHILEENSEKIDRKS